MSRYAILVFAAFIATAFVFDTSACTVFVLTGTESATVGRNYDWDTGNGILIVNKRGMAKTALGMVLDSRENRRECEPEQVEFGSL